MKTSSIDVQYVGHALVNWIALILFNMFTNDLEEEKEWTLKIAHDSKLVDEVNVLCGRAGIQGDVDQLEEWADMNLLKFRRGLCRDLCFRWPTVYWAVS